MTDYYLRWHKVFGYFSINATFPELNKQLLQLYDSTIPGIPIKQNIECDTKNNNKEYFTKSLPWTSPMLTESNYWNTVNNREKSILSLNTKDDSRSSIFICKRILSCSTGFDNHGDQNVSGKFSQKTLSQNSPYADESYSSDSELNDPLYEERINLGQQ